MKSYGFEANCSYVANGNDDFIIGINFKDSNGKEFSTEKHNTDADELLKDVYTDFLKSYLTPKKQTKDVIEEEEQEQLEEMSLERRLALVEEQIEGYRLDNEVLEKRVADLADDNRKLIHENAVLKAEKKIKKNQNSRRRNLWDFFDTDDFI